MPTPIRTCRVCAAALQPAPLLTLSNMPAMAQGFPDRDALEHDHGTQLCVCECSGCGLMQLQGEPVPYHREVIRASAYSPAMREFRLEQFKRWVSDHDLQGQALLEIGCGRGEFLSLFAAAGVRPYGIEAGLAAVADCQARGLPVTAGYIEQADQPLAGGPFAAFAILNFLEHVPAPNTLLQGMRHNLRDAGLGLVEVPNLDMIIKDGLFAEFIADHLFYFTAATLRRTLEINGFEVLDCRPIWHDYILSATVRKRASTRLDHMQARLTRITGELHAYVDRFPAGRVAVWGAGHQALALLSLTGLGPRLRYVVDSAPFKQGRYTPASHLPVVAPETLHHDPVEALLIMAAGYSDEVADSVARNFAQIRHLAIMRNDGLEYRSMTA